VADDSQFSDDFRPAVPLTPSACLETSTARLDRLHEGTAGMPLRAVPVKTGGTGAVAEGDGHHRRPLRWRGRRPGAAQGG
jgi:hypothetical protein